MFTIITVLSKIQPQHPHGSQGLSFPTTDQMQVHGSESSHSKPLDCQRIPIYIIFSTRFSNVKYIYIAVQPIWRALLYLVKWKLCPIWQYFPIFPLTPAPGKPPFYFLSLWLWLLSILHGSGIIQYLYIGEWLKGGSDGKESGRKCRRSGFNLWVRMIPWRRAW